MRPTGRLHLGHLAGALGNWVRLQEEYECFFMVADWHALMSEYARPQEIKENIKDNVIDWIACGVCPQKSHLFIQSHIPQHLELFMLFSLITPLGLLERCPTYKEQLRQLSNRDLSTYGFLGYPVLQAADILLYKAQAVPVGEDQLAHLELTRQIARKFNHLYKTSCFPEPKALLTQTARLLGLDGRKMSKSYDNFILLSESEEAIRSKVGNMFTDPQRIRLSDPGHPHKCNVFSYYTSFFPQMDKQAQERCRNSEIGCTQCKKELAQKLIDLLAPIRQKRLALEKDSGYIMQLLEEGEKKASAVAQETISEVKELLKI